MSLALELLIAVSMVAFTLTVHGLGLTGLLVLIPEHGRRLGLRRALLAEAAVILAVVNAVFFLHLIEILAYALLYRELEAVASFRDSFIFAAGTYATVGSDVSVRRGWRLLAAIEATNGVILLGWTTAFFVAVIARIRALREDWMRRG